MNKKLILAVDGYSSCGKSTFAEMIARELGYIYIDSGAMYRAVTLYVIRQDMVDENGIDNQGIIDALPNISIDFRYNTDNNATETFLNNENVELEIRSVEINAYVSPVSQIKEVRDKMVQLQREIGMYKGIVMDGRDIGTVVFPDAEIKIFMTASSEIRAQRRFDELSARGVNIKYEEILENVIARDTADSGREISPLRKAEDAHVLDNSYLSVEEQMLWFRQLLEKVRNDNRN